MIALSDIENLVSKFVLKQLQADGIFEIIQLNGFALIESYSGIELTPDGELAGGLEWLIPVFAWLCEYLVAGTSDNLSAEYREKLNTNWTKAIELLKANAETSRAGKVAVCGEIEGLYEL